MAGPRRIRIYQRKTFIELLRRFKEGDESEKAKSLRASFKGSVEASASLLRSAQLDLDASGMYTRLFSDFNLSLLLDPNKADELTKKLDKLTSTAKPVKNSRGNGIELVDPQDVKTFNDIATEVINIACTDLLDKNGLIRKDWVELLGFNEFYSEMNKKDNVEKILNSFVKCVLQAIDFKIKVSLGDVGSMSNAQIEFMQGEKKLENCSQREKKYFSLVGIGALIKKSLSDLLDAIFFKKYDRRLKSESAAPSRSSSLSSFPSHSDSSTFSSSVGRSTAESASSIAESSASSSPLPSSPSVSTLLNQKILVDENYFFKPAQEQSTDEQKSTAPTPAARRGKTRS